MGNAAQKDLPGYLSTSIFVISIKKDGFRITAQPIMLAEQFDNGPFDEKLPIFWVMVG
jgi:hypothetical protein